MISAKLISADLDVQNTVTAESIKILIQMIERDLLPAIMPGDTIEIGDEQ